MKLLVCGGRHFNDKEKLFARLDGIHDECEISTIISGMAAGADSLAADWAKLNNVDIDPYPAKWKDLSVPGAVIKTNKYGKYNTLAGHQRNQAMLEQGKPDGVLYTPGGSGTANMINKAREADIPMEALIKPKPKGD